MTYNPKNRFDIKASTTVVSEDDARKILFQALPQVEIKAISKLSGGYSNANFLVKTQDGSYVIRISSKAAIEADVIHLANKHSISVPEIVFQNQDALIMQYNEGETLEDLIMKDVPIPTSVFHLIGKELAKIHAVSFSQSGLLGPGAQISFDTSDHMLIYNQFILAPLNGRAGERLGLLKNKLITFLEKNWPQIGKVINPCLVHSDFNPKNILISPQLDKVTILDWEFAMSGERLMDLGNFLRFESDYTESQKKAFIEGYESVAEVLPLDWREIARLHDLISMITFLNSEEEKPKTFATARRIIEESLN